MPDYEREYTMSRNPGISIKDFKNKTLMNSFTSGANAFLEEVEGLR